MKILWVSHLVPYPPKAGVLIRSYNLLRELGSRHDVDLLMINQQRLLSSYYSSEAEGIDAARKALHDFIGEIRVVPLEHETSRIRKLWLVVRSFFSFESYTTRWLQGRIVRDELNKLISSKDYDLIHLDTISLDFLRPQIPAEIPVVLDHHNIESHMMGRRVSKETNLLKRLYFQWEHSKLQKYERRSLPKYDAHIVCSDDDAKRLNDLSSDSAVETIPNGIRLDDGLPERNIVSGRLLFIGGLSWYPNQAAIRDFLDSIAPALRSRSISFHFDIIGKNPPSDLAAQISTLEDVTLHGFVDDIAPFYQVANIYVCPINDGGGTKLKVLDAMAKRVPLIGYPLAFEGIEIEDGVHALIAYTAEDFVDKIERLINDHRLAETIGDAGHKLIRSHYEFSMIGEKMSDFYERVRQQEREGQ